MQKRSSENKKHSNVSNTQVRNRSEDYAQRRNNTSSEDYTQRRVRYVSKRDSSSGISKIKQLQTSNKMDMPLLIVVLMLVALGIVMVLSASAPSALADYGNSYHYLMTQGLAAILGLAAMFFFSRFNYKIFKKYYIAIYVASVAILFTVLIPGIGMEVSGAKRWIDLGIQIQPSEISKIGFIIFLAGYYTDPRNKLDNFWKVCFAPLVLIAIPILILYKVQNHLSAGIIIAIVSIIMVIMSGCQFKYLATMAGMGLVGLSGIFMIFKDKITNGFRSDRVMAWLNPWEDTSGTSYQTVQSLYAIGSGGFFGVGLGESKQKYLYIPEAHNDFIFAILAEELGFVGCLLVITLFAILVVRGVLIAIRAEDVFSSLLAIGITALIAIQVILNIAVVTNTIPNTGISLPFLSYGGSSLIILLSSMGLLLNISRRAKKI